MADSTVLGQMRDQRLAAERIARHLGVSVNDVLYGYTTNEGGRTVVSPGLLAQQPSMMDNGDQQQALAASQYNEQNARRAQSDKAMANGIPAEGENFIDGISNPVSQLNSTLPIFQGPQSILALRNHPKASELMPDAARFAEIASGTPRTAVSPLNSTIADAYQGIRASQAVARDTSADNREATQRALMASIGNDYSRLFDVYRPAELTAKLARHDQNNIDQRNELSRLRMEWNSRTANAQVAEDRSPLNMLSQMRDLFDAGLLRRIHDSMAGGRNLPPRPEDVPSVSAPRNV